MFFVVPSTAVRLPALKDGETVIFGANAICYYIGFKHDLKNTMNCSNDCEVASNLSSVIENLLDFEESKLSPTVETLKKSKFIFYIIIYLIRKSLSLNIFTVHSYFYHEIYPSISSHFNEFFLLYTDLSDHKTLASMITMIENLEAYTNSNSCSLVLYPVLSVAFDLLQKRKFNSDIYVKLNMFLNEIKDSPLFLSANNRLAESHKISNNTVGKTAQTVS